MNKPSGGFDCLAINCKFCHNPDVRYRTKLWMNILTFPVPLKCHENLFNVKRWSIIRIYVSMCWTMLTLIITARLAPSLWSKLGQSSVIDHSRLLANSDGDIWINHLRKAIVLTNIANKRILKLVYDPTLMTQIAFFRASKILLLCQFYHVDWLIVNSFNKFCKFLFDILVECWCCHRKKRRGHKTFERRCK